jgi:general secretion pathway protein A
VSILKFNEMTAVASMLAGTGPAAEGRRGGIYAAFFGLEERPFDLTPNPRFLYLSSRQREALSNLRYGLTTPRGFTLLIGEAGCGKTTILHAILSELNDSKNRCVFVSNPTLSREEFYQSLAHGFGLSESAAHSKTRFLEELRRDIEMRFAEGGLTGLVIDEAQSLPYELLEEVRLLGNLETTSEKLLNIVLSGQPELSERLSESSLRQLKQRVALRCELKPFDVSETSSYIAGRLRIAGGLPENIFTRDAVIAIHNATAGLPRTINVVCDNALIGGFAEQVKPVTARIVEEVVRDFDIRRKNGAPEAVEIAAAHANRDEPPAPVDEPMNVQPSLGTLSRIKQRFSFFSLVLMAMMLSAASAGAQGAASPAPAAAEPGASSHGQPPANYVIGPEDVLGIVFWREQEMTGDVVVRPDGKITLPLVGDLPAAGLTPDALRETIVKAAGKYLQDLNVTVVVRQINSRKVFITGQVVAAAAYPIVGPRTVMQLIALAGGLTEYADKSGITIVRVEDGQTRTFKFNYSEVAKGRKLEQNIQLQPGDTVVVP